MSNNLFYEYVKKGVSVIPIGHMKKFPCYYNGNGYYASAWGHFQNRLANEDECNTWEVWPNVGTGMVLGKISGIVALDFDDDMDGLHEKIKALIPDSPVKKIGAKGLTAFYRYSGEKAQKWHPVIEILSDGNQTVIPPSVHPTTQKPYYWVGKGFLDVNIEDLPILPSDIHAQIDKLMGKDEKPEPQHIESYSSDEPPSLDEIRDALDHISPDCGYEEWLSIGMAIKEECGDSGFHTWDSWSHGGARYPKKGESTTHTKWKSFNKTGVGIGTLFKMAMDNGYSKYSKSEHVDVPLITIIEGGNLKPIKERVAEGFPEHLLNAPGLVGLLQKWITSTAYYQQPVLSLAAAVAAVGAVMAHKVQTETRSRTNMLVMGVAPSGSGKEHPRQAVDKIIHLSGNGDLMGGEPASSAGLLKSMKDGNGRRLIQIDEFGRILKTLTGKGAASHMAGVTTIIMKMFSSANTTYYGSEYANPNGDRKRDDIDQPCLCIHGSTVPEHLYDSMCGNDAIDGFLSRWLIFESKDFPIDMGTPEDLDTPPDYIVELLRKWVDRPTNCSPKGNLDVDTVIKPEIIPFAPEAKKIAMEFQRAMRIKTKGHQERGDGMHSIWARTFEHSTKLALIAHEGDMISVEAMRWAIEVSRYNSQYLCDQIELRISDNEQEHHTKWVLRLIKDANGGNISKSSLTRKTQRLDRRKRDDIINTLIDSNQIQATQDGNSVSFKSLI